MDASANATINRVRLDNIARLIVRKPNSNSDKKRLKLTRTFLIKSLHGPLFNVYIWCRRRLSISLLYNYL